MRSARSPGRIETPGWTLTPRLSFNAASYALDQPMSDGRTSASRIIPTASLDSAWVFERGASWFDKAVRQTLEPRVMYVYTPYVNQSAYPLFDTAPKDFNFESIFTENAFSGVDRVSDGNQLTAGLTSRVIDPANGAEALRLAVVQRVRFADQRVTPDGQPQTKRFSDVLVAGSTTLLPRLDAGSLGAIRPRPAVAGAGAGRHALFAGRVSQRQPELPREPRPERAGGTGLAVAGVRPDATRTRAFAAVPKATAGSGGCQGSVYTVGRLNYSLKDSRITTGLLGFEYDSGCWIGRIVAERVSTGLSSATTRVMLQLELVGLSRLGANPLQLLKDNIPGYQLLRDTRAAPAPLLPYE